MHLSSCCRVERSPDQTCLVSAVLTHEKLGSTDVPLPLLSLGEDCHVDLAIDKSYRPIGFGLFMWERSIYRR